MTRAAPAPLLQIAEHFVQGDGVRAIAIDHPTLATPVSCKGDQRFASASLVKVAIACAAWDAAEAGRLDLRHTTPVRDLDPTGYCSILKALEPEHPLTLHALIGLMLIVSDNPATTRVVELVGVGPVQDWLRTNGLTNTNFGVGFEDKNLGKPLRANHTTAHDCLTLLHVLRDEQRYDAIRTFLTNNLRNERIPKRLPDTVDIAHKTGSLAGLCHDMALIDAPSGPISLVLLCDEQADTARAQIAMAETALDVLNAFEEP